MIATFDHAVRVVPLVLTAVGPAFSSHAKINQEPRQTTPQSGSRPKPARCLAHMRIISTWFSPGPARVGPTSASTLAVNCHNPRRDSSRCRLTQHSSTSLGSLRRGRVFDHCVNCRVVSAVHRQGTALPRAVAWAVRRDLVTCRRCRAGVEVGLIPDEEQRKSSERDGSRRHGMPQSNKLMRLIEVE